MPETGATGRWIVEDRARADPAPPGEQRRDRRRVEHIMGTVIGVDIRDPEVPASVFDDVFAFLRDVDARFSIFRPDSEISRLGRGELREADCSPDVRRVLALCDDLGRTSGGFFDIGRHRPDGRLDPSGLVKGWSIEEAAWLIGAAGGRNFSVNAGGDVVANGEPEPGRRWRVGIRHPLEGDRIAAVLRVRDGAVATSGAYERGAHIVDPHTGLPPDGLLSVTVVGPSLARADAYATAAFAMGRAGIGWVADLPGYGALGITTDGRAIWTEEVEAVMLHDRRAGSLDRPGRLAAGDPRTLRTGRETPPVG